MLLHIGWNNKLRTGTDVTDWPAPMQVQDERPGLDFIGMNYYGK